MISSTLYHHSTLVPSVSKLLPSGNCLQLTAMCTYSQKECARNGEQNELALISGQRKSVLNICQCVFPQVISYCNCYIIGYNFEMKEMTKNGSSCCKHLTEVKFNLSLTSV